MWMELESGIHSRRKLKSRPIQRGHKRTAVDTRQNNLLQGTPRTSSTTVPISICVPRLFINNTVHSYIIFGEPRLMSMKRGHPFTLSDIRSAQAQYLGSEPTTRFGAQQSLGHCVNRFTTQHGHQQSTARFLSKNPVYCPVGSLTIC